MIFPAHCKDKITQGIVYIPRRDGFNPSIHEYIRAITLETQEEIQAKPSHQDQFMALQSKGWTFLNKAERELYKQLKLQMAQADIQPL